MRAASIIFLLLLGCGGPNVATAQSTAQSEASEKEEWARMMERVATPRAFNLLHQRIWELTHSGDGKPDDALALLEYLRTSSVDPKVGSAREFKNKVASFLEHDDERIVVFAATLLGFFKDLSYAPAVAKLLDRRDPDRDADRFTVRGHAAIALGEMGAKEYVPRLAVMLKSRNENDRAGAVTALGQLKAREYAKDIAVLLRLENRGSFYQDAPIDALMELGVGTEYTAEFAKILRENGGKDLTMSAAYAIAKLGAREYTKDVARLLNEEFRKDDGAKVLAIMGATEYTDQIARLLDDPNSLTRRGALLALGIMRAKKYQAKIARHLNDAESFVQIYAAYALVILEADQYAPQVLPKVEHLYEQNIPFGASEFHPFVEDERKKIDERFREAFMQMKSKQTRRLDA